MVHVELSNRVQEGSFCMTNSKISIFGASGFIGSRYCDLYDDIIKIHRSELNPQSDEVLYLISTVDNYNVFDNPLLDVETNLIHLIKVLEKCKERKDLTFNFVSSWFVYGKTTDLPAKEDSHCNPTGFYSITKRAAEQLIVSYCETFGLNYRILRLSNVYGPRDKKASKKKNAMQHMVCEILENRDINLYNNGENIRDFLHVDDICRAINLVIKNGDKNTIINIGSGKPQKIIEIVERVRQKVGSTTKFNFVSPPHFHKIVQIENMYLDTTKLKSLGFEQTIDIESGIDDLVREMRTS